MSQNKMNDHELNTMNITDDELLLSDEMIQAYMDASALETPDLWSRVESGFEQEIKMLQQERTTQFTNAMNYMPQDTQQNTPSNIQQFTPKNMQQGVPNNAQQFVPQGNPSDNVVDISKRVARKKTFAAIAAIVVLCIIAVPVMKMVGNNNHKSDEARTTAAAFDYAADDKEASYKGKEDADEAPAAEMQDEADSVDSDYEAGNQQHINAITDSGVANTVAIKTTGYFVYDGDTLIFMIETIINDPTGKLFEGSVIELHDSDAAAATYFEKIDSETAYGPYETLINVDADSVNSLQITGVLLEK